MNFLLVMTVIFNLGEEPKKIEIGLVNPQFCQQLGQLVSVDVMQTTSAVSVAFTCTEQVEG